MNKVLFDDIQGFSQNFALSEDFSNTSFLITGATGLIGSILCHCLMALNKNIRIIAPVRDIEKAKEKLGHNDKLTFIECDLELFDFSKIGDVDYIIHCAAPTSSKFFVEHPVETYHTICNISDKVLDYARKIDVKSMVYLSSLEVYGQILDDSKPVTEDVQGYLDPLDVRSSYPMAKRSVENLCCLYAKEYGVPVRVARLTQTTGAGCDKQDNRVIVQFTRLVEEGDDIVLHTPGESSRPYCYTIDAVSAILYILLKGEVGNAYNVANEETYISARQLAEYLRDNFNPAINVKVEISDNMGYAPATKQRLSAGKLKKLGWQPRYDLFTMITRLKDFLNEQRND